MSDHQNFYIGDSIKHDGKTYFIRELHPDGVLAVTFADLKDIGELPNGLPQAFIPCTELANKKMEWVLSVWKDDRIVSWETEADEQKARRLKVAYEKAGCSVKFYQREVPQ